jgi:hypothetical protein
VKPVSDDTAIMAEMELNVKVKKQLQDENVSHEERLVKLYKIEDEIALMHKVETEHMLVARKNKNE